MTRARRHGPVLLLMLVLGAIAFGWFRDGQLVNGGDTNFPLRPQEAFAERLSAWNAAAGTGTDASATFGSVPFHALQAALAHVGLSLVEVERWTFVFWFVAIGLSMYFFAGVLDQGPRAGLRIVATLIYSLNPYLFDTWMNAKVANLALYVALPLVLGLFLLACERRLRLHLFAALLVPVAVVCAAVGVNPSYALVLAGATGVLVTFAAVTSARPMQVLKVALVGGGAYLTASAFWLFPLTYFLSRFEGLPSLGALSTADWLAGISSNTSLLNVSRMIGAWDWFVPAGDLPYHEFPERYLENPLLIGLTFVVPVAAWARPLLHPVRWQDWYLFSLAVAGMALAAGAHRPFGGIYVWLVEHVPMLSFFRSPWYIFTPLIALAYALLASETIGRISDAATNALARRFPSQRRVAAVALAVVGIVGLTVYAYPLLSGQIFGGGERQANDFKIDVPPYVIEAAEWLDTRHEDGRVLLLPRDRVEVMDWDYASIVPVLDLAAAAGVVHEPYEPGNSTPAVRLQKRAYDALLGGAPEAPYLLGLLRVDWLNFRRDARAVDAPGFALRSPDLVTRHASLVRSIGEWDFLRLHDRYRLPHVYAADSVRGLDALATKTSEWGRVVYVRDGDLPSLKTDELFRPRLVTHRSSATRYSVDVRGARGPFALVLAETFDRGWSVRVADSSGTPAEAHFLANGYANGWIVERTGDFQLVVEYSPHRYAVAGAAVTSAALVGAGLVLLAAALRRRGWA